MSSLITSRRALLLGVLATAACSREPPHPRTRGPHTYQTGPLAGRMVVDLYATYIGYSGRGPLPATIQVDWQQRLERLWEAKRHRAHDNPVVRQTEPLILAEYASHDPGRMSIERYREIGQQEANRLWGQMDWHKVGESYFRGQNGVNKRKLKLMRRIAENIGGKSLTAYAMTELLPSNDGQFNRNYLNFLLQNAGRRYVESIPAQYDRYTSFGPFQFTSFAVFHTPRGCFGASRMNQCLRQSAIPGSVMLLRENDHFRAGYLFALHNIAILVRRLNDQQLGTLEQVWQNNMVELAQFAATAHHLPEPAFDSAERWLDNWARTPYRFSCGSTLQAYAVKTLNNYRAL